MKESIRRNQKKIWYMLCFFALGIIDQRRGSALGEIQMAASNCTGLVLAAMLLPSFRKGCFRHREYLWWTVIGVILSAAACIWGWQNWFYKGQWITGVLNVFVWGYLILYIWHERKNPEVSKRWRQPFFWCIAALFLLMFLSAHKGLMPLWALLIFGGFYLIGIPKESRDDFFQGMLNGIILWFFVQQIVAFGFRPYDYVRYCGLYSGETQNGLFYMIVYCAFLCKWIWAKDNKKHFVFVWGYFFLSAGSISFLLFTGGRSSLMGAAFATLALYTVHDIIWKKSFYRWMLHAAVLGLCVIITFPMVYGCIRYLPVILHHPIWFEGEYREWESVRSFDPWNSERYITFEEAVENNVGRILQMFGIDISAGEDKVSSFWTLRAKAAEKSEGEGAASGNAEPGSSPDHPFMLPGTDMNNSISIRKTIYVYYLRQLNLWGHDKEQYGFYMTELNFYEHAHNMLIQMAYDYGIAAGLLFLGLVCYSLVYFLKRGSKGPENHSWICLGFFSAIFFYGQTEMAIVPGMMTWVLIYLLFYFAGEDSKIVDSTSKHVVN